MRILLFLIGLLYGAIVNSVLLGLAYGIYAAGLTLIGICEACCGRGNNGCLLSGSGEGAMAILVVIGIICLAAAALGFVGGVLYGLFAGAWHCGMDFYNNGLSRGLSSPFRFLSAKWSHDIDQNPTKLREYYASTGISFLEKKRAAQREVRRRSRRIHTTIAEIEKAEDIDFPKRLSQMIAGYTLTPSEIEIPVEISRSKVGQRIETTILPTSVEAKENSVATVEAYLTVDETTKIIQKQRFFSESQSNPEEPTRKTPCCPFEKAGKNPPRRSRSKHTQ